MATKFPWLKLGKKTDPELPCEPPVWLGNRSNGEYYRQQTPREEQMRQEIFRRADAEAPRHGLDRRSFLASSFGIATTLTVINEMGCKSSDNNTGPACSPEAGYATPQGTAPFVVPPPTTCDASQYLAGDEFIFDVQTHCFDAGEWRTRNIVYPTFLNLLGQGASWCANEKNVLDCFDPQHYAELMFVDSDTTMSVITSWPAAQCFPERDLLSNSALACGLPLSNAGMRNLRDWINAKALSQRCINQVQVMPNDFIEHQIEGMYAAMADPSWKCGSWKAYPAWTSDTYPSDAGYAQGYYMTDPVGRKFIEAGLKLGVPNFAIHKGLPIPGFDVIHNEPTDIGPIAVDYPEANFVIYHSAINAGTGGTALAALAPTHTENVPYSSTDPKPLGVNMLIRSLINSGLIDDPDHPNPKFKKPARLNVFAEMGSAWSQVMTDTNSMQHYMGKLLKYLGPNNIVWGTDCILGGSPQQQILAFRAFTITPEYQSKYGYPAITDAMKRQIFGLNAAAIYHVDPTTARCAVQNSSFSMMKRDLDQGVGPNRWTVKPPLGPRNYEEFLANARQMRTKRVPG
jgi:predicted TIM-barrel fold metal-dependent hydrolase